MTTVKLIFLEMLMFELQIQKAMNSKEDFARLWQQVKDNAGGGVIIYRRDQPIEEFLDSFWDRSRT